MDIGVPPRPCANPGCHNLVPAAQPGHRAKLTCSDRCRKAASRQRQQEAARRQAEEARRARQERWQGFLPATRSSLERLEALAGARLAEELAEAIGNELASVHETHDLLADTVTFGAGQNEALREPNSERGITAWWQADQENLREAEEVSIPNGKSAPLRLKLKED